MLPHPFIWTAPCESFKVFTDTLLIIKCIWKWMSHITVLSSYHFHCLQMCTCHLPTPKKSQPYWQDFWTILELSKRQNNPLDFVSCTLHWSIISLFRWSIWEVTSTTREAVTKKVKKLALLYYLYKKSKKLTASRFYWLYATNCHYTGN